MTGEQWVQGLNRLTLPPDLPITLQGGEPTTHKDFVYIVNNIRKDIKIDILTNFELDLDKWLYQIDPLRLRHNGLYAPIRISWHKGQHELESLLKRASEAQRRGYDLGIWTVDHPEYHDEVIAAQAQARDLGIDFRLKEFLGPHKGVIHGTFRYPEAVDSRNLRFAECRTTELLIAPDGGIFRCHSDLYAARLPIGHILSDFTPLIGKWVPCAVYGACNSCDLKVKNNRHQQWGHSSVEIKNITEAYKPNPNYVQEVENTYGKA